jgi:VanZ family protein
MALKAQKVKGVGRRPMIGRRKRFLLKVANWSPVAGYVLLIFAASSISNPPAVGAAPSLDKIAHFVEYGILGCLLGRAMGFPSRRERAWGIFFLTIGIGAFIGFGDEMYQGTVAGREKSHWDLIMDIAGVVASQIALLWWSLRLGRARRVSVSPKTRRT